MQTHKLFDQEQNTRENKADLLRSLRRTRVDLSATLDDLAFVVRWSKADYPHAAGFVSASRAEIMSAIDSLNVAERYLA